MIEDYNILKLIPAGELSDMLPPWFKFHTAPWAHQVPSTIACMAEDGFLLQLDLGTGKTKVIIDTLRYLKRELGKINVIVLCTSAAVDKWVEEIHTHSKELKATAANQKNLSKEEKLNKLCDSS